jgi:pimeloyl-ACP methyl ester carboxylesterase
MAQSEGKPGERQLKADGLATFDAIAATEGIDANRIVVFGRSLWVRGGRARGRRSVAGAVLVPPYDSLVAAGALHYPWLPVSLLLRHRFEAAADAARCRMPLLAIVGEDDTIIPVARSRALYDAWAGPKTWYAVRGGDHNTLAATREFWDEIDRFLDGTRASVVP